MLTEAEVQAAFVLYLVDRGWDVRTENADHAAVVATRGAEQLVAEVKGTTEATGTDVDTGYGQLLRRMLDAGTSYALVVPERARAAALRVPAPIRRRLDITVFLVDDLGQVHRLGPDEPDA
ncbi:hypothetical protein QWY28_23090 [Nocardioides sp. SOB77]|uniref:Restriction endonuclease type IV Mrr domain-containing protein n=1 Tax=Nocardioides oceani TaxID=3058369 RepID=A0ABT8FMH6_9ACTN|nr:hypothetical protein [Nocardioides oceani]MDN4175861.1 hypothetical protein [Nocardioides oceani]